MIRHALTVFRKEVRDNLRDRRSIISSLALAALSPVFFVGMMAFMLESALGESDEALPFTVVGAEHAPELMAYFERNNTDVTTRDLADPEDAVREGDETLVLVIPRTYGEDFSSGRHISLPLIYDSSGFGSSRRKFNQARTMIGQYSRTLGVLRLQLRGIAPAVTAPLGAREIDTASPAARALLVLAMLPYLLIMVVFMGGFYLAIDSTAGEREHGSLEPLLSQPAARSSLVLGKIIATSLFATIALVFFIITFTIAIPLVPFHKAGMALTFGADKALACVAVTLPLVLLAAAMLTAFASFTKSYKEAQTYLSLVVAVPTLPLIVTRMLDVENSWWLMLIPSVSQANLVSSIMTDVPVTGLHVLISVTATLVLASVMVWIAVTLYRRERILG